MEETNQSQESKHLTTEGENGIVTKLEKEARKNLFYKLNTNSGPGKDLQKICDTYIRAKTMADRQPEGTKEKFKDIIKRLKGRAKAKILKKGECDVNTMALFGFKQIDFPVRKILLRKYLIDFVLNALNSDEFFREAISKLSKTGHMVDYIKYREMTEQLTWLINADNDYSVNESAENLYERHREICEISDKVTAELNLQNKEKSRRPNLCYFLLADENGILNPDSSTMNSEEKETERVNSEVTLYLISRIQNLSETNLIELIRIYCKANNEFYKTIIDEEKKSNKMKKNKDAYKRKRFFTPEDTRGLVRLYKDDGLSNKQIAKETGFKLRTVERYSTN